MKTTHSFIARSLTTLAASLALLTATASAQLVADGQTNTISSGTTSVSGDFIVGTNGSFTGLIVSNGATLNVSAVTRIGFNSGANSNYVQVSGAGSQFFAGVPTNFTLAGLYVGQNGSFNRLVVSNGAELVQTSFRTSVGDSAGSSNNQLIVTGTNSRMTNADTGTYLLIGNSGSGNALTINNGGVVRVAFSDVGSQTNASNNQVLLNSSMWVVRTNLVVGNAGSGNRLVVTNGAKMVCNKLIVGGEFASPVGHSGFGSNNEVIVTGTGSRLTGTNGFSGGPGALLSVYVGGQGDNNRLVIERGGGVGVAADFSEGVIGYIGNNNEAVVTGAGSSWIMNQDLIVGNRGSGNRLLISNAGIVACIHLTAGMNSSSSNNVVRNDGGFLTVSNISGNGPMDIRRGTLLFNGGTINADRLLLTNGASSVMQFNSGNLNTRGLTNNNGSAFVVGDGTGTANLFLEGTNGHFFGAGLTVRSNSTAFLNGGVVTSPSGLTIQGGGRVSVGSSNVLAAGTPLFLVGGTFSLEGHTQGPGLGGLSQTVESDIDFGALGTAQILSFNDLAAHAAGNLLHISHWEGTAGIGGGTDELLITTTNSVTAAFLADVQFDGYAPGAILLGTGELVPVGVPEPTTVALGVLGVAIFFSRRGARLLGKLISFAASLALLTNIATAQLVADGQTNILVGVTSILSGGLTVGSNDSFTLLGLTGGSVVGTSFLTPSTFSGIGANSGANSNTVLVTDVNSAWTNGWLQIGPGSYNRLIVSNGAMVVNEIVNFGPGGPSGSNNSILVTGAGSRLITHAGFTNWENQTQIIVNNGGFVSNSVTDFLGSNSFILVTDPGSVMSGSIGLKGLSNRVFVTNGATIQASVSINGNGAVLRIDGSSLVATNLNRSITVGNGSLIFNGGLINSTRLGIGGGGMLQFNSGILRTRGLTNNNGSAFVVGDGTGTANLFLEGTNGHFFGAGLTVRSNSTAFLNGGVVTSPSGLTIQGGGRVSVGSNNVLAAGTPLFLVGGTFSLEGHTQGPGLGALSQTAESDIDFGALGTAQILSFSDLAAHAAGNLLHISHWEGTPGIGGGTDELLITTTNSVTAAFLADVQFDGYTPGAILLGTGELVPVGVPEPATVALGVLGVVIFFSRRGARLLGKFISFAASLALLTATASAQLVADGQTNTLSGATNNLVGALTVGTNGSFSTLNLLSAVTVSDTTGRIGLNGGANNNSVVVAGPAALWTNSSSVAVGVSGNFNQLTVSNGATVASLFGDIGGNAGANGNSAFITGNGSLWNNYGTNPGSLTVGGGGSLNQLIVNQHGTVLNTIGAIGSSAGAVSNLVLVSDSGSLWSNSSSLLVGNSGSFNQMVISNGGTVINGTATIGANGGANSNLVVVTGPGASWNSSNAMNIGNNGSFNQLVIDNGGAVTASSGSIGTGTNGMGNSALVTGAGSLWTLSGFLLVGNQGGGNQFVIANGGRVSNTNATVGAFSNSTGNVVLVTDAGSSWLTAANLTVGAASVGNRMTISNAGLVVSATGTIGSSVGADSNLVVVTGGGSTWSNSGTLNIGGQSSFNRMVISKGGTVVNGFGEIGTSPSGRSNEVLVTDSGSVWSNLATLYVGFNSSGNRLTITNGGRVITTAAAYFGNTAGSSNNVGVVTGSGSTLTVSSSLRVGNQGSGNQLFIANGGSVSVSNGVFVTADLTTGNNNLLQVSNGTLQAQNNAGNSTLDVRSGTVQFNGGTINADRMLLTNGAAGVMQFNSGTLRTRGLTNNNGNTFVVGDASGTANLFLEGTNGHFFGADLTVRSNSTAFLNGGVVTSPSGLSIQAGGRVSAGSNNVLASGTPLFLVGGTFSLEGHTQGQSLGGLSQTVESDIDFGALGTAQILSFSDLAAHAAGNLLHVSHWEGTPSTGGGTDELLITTTNSVTAAFLADVQFDGYAPGAILLGTGELVPVGVPEPATVVFVGLGAAVLLVRGRVKLR